MYKKTILFIALLLFFTYLHCTKVLFIENETLAPRDDENSISFVLMKSIMEQLGLEFEYAFVEHLEAMQSIDDAENVIIFPYIIPRNMSNRILVSDTLHVINHKVFYNERLYGHVEVNNLRDLQTYIIGSYALYPYEVEFRRAGLTVLYSNNNQESMQRLVNQEVGFVIEELNTGIGYLENTEGAQKINIKIHDIDLFPLPLFVVAAHANQDAANVISQINDLIRNRRE